MSGFWTWAGAHPFLTTIIILSITKTTQVIVKAIRPERTSPSEPEAEAEPTPIPAPRPRPLPEKPVKRRTMWERLSRDD